MEPGDKFEARIEKTVFGGDAFCKAPDGMAVYIENLSDDAGGMVRVGHYLDTLRWSGSRGILLCLVDSIESIPTELFMESNYYQQIKNGGEVFLKPVFATYQDFSRRTGYVEISADGTVIPFTWSE